MIVIFLFIYYFSFICLIAFASSFGARLKQTTTKKQTLCQKVERDLRWQYSDRKSDFDHTMSFKRIEKGQNYIEDVLSRMT